MRQRYIAPETFGIKVETQDFIAMTIQAKRGNWMQYDGDPLHNDMDIHNNNIAGSASEYTGTKNILNPINEDDIFNDTIY